MMKRLITALAVWGCGIAALHAADVVTISGVEGDVGQQVELSVCLTTDTPDIVAAEIHVPLPEQITAVSGSCVKSDTRLPDHSVSADMRNGELVAVIFNTSLKQIPVGAGEVFTVTLNLGENPGVFTLTPTVRFSDAAGKAVAGTAESFILDVKGARLELGAMDIDFGRVPIRETYTRTVTATNTGTATLAISDITTDVPGLSVEAGETSVAPGGTTQLTLTYAPMVRAKQIAGRFTVLSNSVGRAPFVRVTSVPFSVNEIHVGDAEGISDEEVTVAVMMNNMEPITGAEMTFTLPEALEYMEGSLAASSRASKLSVASNFGSNRQLRLILYSAANTPVEDDDGELLTFKLRLKGRSGRYSLTPQKVILSNADGENMVSATSGGYVTISSPSLVASSRFDIGNVPLSGEDTFDYPVRNSSNVPLTIERVAFLKDIAECKAEFPIVVEPYGEAMVPVTIKSPEFGDFSTVMNLYSNDPDNRLKSVEVSGSFYSANELTVSGKLDGDTYVITASMTNEADIVALQLDIVMPDGITLSSSDLQLLDRATTHSSTLASVGKNLYRLLIFSLSNTPFTGNSGSVFALSIPKENIEAKEIRFEKIKLSSATGVNYTNPNAEILVTTVPTFLKAISLSETELTLNPGNTVQLTATPDPANADNVEFVWTSSDESVATVDSEGLVSALKLGEAIIRVESAHDSSVFAECTVKVNIETGVGVISGAYSVCVEGFAIRIFNLNEGMEVSLYATDGVLVSRQICRGSELKVEVPSTGVYLLRVNGEVMKLLVK